MKAEKIFNSIQPDSSEPIICSCFIKFQTKVGNSQYFYCF